MPPIQVAFYHEGDAEIERAKINSGFRTWFTDVILPPSRMKPEDYSVGAVSA